MDKKEYLKHDDPRIPERSKDQMAFTYLLFTKNYLVRTISIGSRLLENYKKEKGLSTEDRLQYHQKSYDSLDSTFKEIAITISRDDYYTKFGTRLEKDTLDSIANDILSMNQTADYYFFLLSFNQVISFLHKSCDYVNELWVDYNRLNKEFNHIIQVRNIYEHFSGHIDKKLDNRYKKDQLDKNYVMDHEYKSLSDATGVFGRGTLEDDNLDLIIGNRVSVRDVVMVSKEILIKLIPLMKNR